MIKINLLPNKRKPVKKLSVLQQQMILGTLILAITCGGMGYFWLSWNARVEELKNQEAEAKAKEAQQNSTLNEVKNVEEERKKVSEKIAIIEQLKKNQGAPVRLLDEVSRTLPKGININSLTEKSGMISLDGMAFSNNEIVRFVDALKANRYMRDAFLLESKQGKADNVEVYQYKLQFNFKGE